MEALKSTGIDPSLRGTLAREPLARLLAVVLAPAATGTLELTHPDGPVSQIVLARGELARIRVPRPPLYLGSIAYELGVINAEALNATLLQVARTKRLHGALLVEQRLITPDQLQQCLAEQAARKLHALFASPPETSFAFYPDYDALADFGGKDWPRCSTRASIWYGIREFPPVMHVEAALSEIEGARFRLKSAMATRGLGLAPEELAVAECLIVKPMSLEELVGLGTLDRRRTELLLYCLLLVGALDRLGAAALDPVPPRRASGARPVLPPPPSSESPPEVPRRPASGVIAKAMPGPAAPWDREAAGKIFERAYAAMLAGKLQIAEVLCGEAHQADPHEVNHNALRIWIRSLRPEGQSEAATRAAVVALSRIIEAHDESAHAHFFRGQLYKRLGRHEHAAADFRATLEFDSKRLDAVAELRLYMARKRRG